MHDCLSSANRRIEKRLEQGFLPSPAPVGYLDRGAGKAEVDPERGPLIRLAFTWYYRDGISIQLSNPGGHLFKISLKDTSRT
jgi:hypothetical protein